MKRKIFIILFIVSILPIYSEVFFNGNVYPEIYDINKDMYGLYFNYMSNEFSSMQIKRTKFIKNQYESYMTIYQFEYDQDGRLIHYNMKSQENDGAPVKGWKSIKYEYENDILVSAIDHIDRSLFSVKEYNTDGRISKIYASSFLGPSKDSEGEAMEYNYYYYEDGSVHSITSWDSRYIFKNGNLVAIYKVEQPDKNDVDEVLKATQVQYYDYDIDDNLIRSISINNYFSGNDFINKYTEYQYLDDIPTMYIYREKGYPDRKWYYKPDYDEFGNIINLNILYENEFIVANFVFEYRSENDYTIYYYNNNNQLEVKFDITYEK